MAALVLDAQPLIAVIANEALAEDVAARLESALAAGDRLVISSVNWCEVLYTTRRLLGSAVTRRAIDLMRRMPIAVIEAGEEHATYAAEMKARHGLGLGDAFAAGLALALGAPLLTGDADFLPLAVHGLEIDWVGSEER
ncbi:MAG: PIN domain-containing protein [Coriobacteriia bacterium]|nr:PIN domain-containing protein [Coriobacteriia bacterium]